MPATNPVQSRSSITRAFDRMMGEYAVAAPIIQELAQDEAYRQYFNSSLKLPFTPDFHTDCPIEGISFFATAINYDQVPEIEVLDVLELPSPEEVTVSSRTLAQCSGGLFNSAKNRLKTPYHAWGYSPNGVWSYKPLTRTFQKTGESQLARIREEKARESYGDKPLARSASGIGFYAQRSKRWHKRNGFSQID